MEAWLWWLLVAGGLAVAELSTLSFVLVMVAGGAAASSLTAAVGGPVWLQFVVLAVVTSALILGVRPVVQRHLTDGPAQRSGTARLVGNRAVVLSRTDAHDGRVRLNGGEWSARADDRREVLTAGTPVIVVAIEGATAVVVRDPSETHPQVQPDGPGRTG